MHNILTNPFILCLALPQCTVKQHHLKHWNFQNIYVALLSFEYDSVWI
jgi:hypothetical protein